MSNIIVTTIIVYTITFDRPAFLAQSLGLSVGCEEVKVWRLQRPFHHTQPKQPGKRPRPPGVEL